MAHPSTSLRMSGFCLASSNALIADFLLSQKVLLILSEVEGWAAANRTGPRPAPPLTQHPAPLILPQPRA
ncbi:MAG: hypothetical protein Q8L84_03225 [Hyphomonas sp.]|nr:hypothetical protein [Hyphomonas sp.]